MRLLDRILTEGITAFGDDAAKAEARELFSSLPESQLVVIDNVAEYYYREMERKRVGGTKVPLHTSDFPNVMLPFSQTFMEFRAPAGNILQKFFPLVGFYLEMAPVESNYILVACMIVREYAS